MICSCHNDSMYWSIDARYRAGGFWQCRAKRRERNARRLSVFGQRLYLPDLETREFALQLREQRKEERR